MPSGPAVLPFRLLWRPNDAKQRRVHARTPPAPPSDRLHHCVRRAGWRTIRPWAPDLAKARRIAHRPPRWHRASPSNPEGQNIGKEGQHVSWPDVRRLSQEKPEHPWLRSDLRRFQRRQGQIKSHCVRRKLCELLANAMNPLAGLIPFDHGRAYDRQRRPARPSGVAGKAVRRQREWSYSDGQRRDIA